MAKNESHVIELLLALVLSALLLFPIIIIALIVKLTSPGPALHWSLRAGRHGELFLMPMFRSMIVSTPDVATHDLVDPSRYVTNFGHFLRKTSLDELPQLYSVIKGDMSFVGPRPALHSQKDLIEARKELGISSLKPGITGWAQVNGRDSISLEEKVMYEYEYLEKKSFYFNARIILLTFTKVIFSRNISH